MKKWAWTLFWILGLTWGSSFMFIRIGVQEINPFQLVFIRVGIAAVGLMAIIFIRRIPLPDDPMTWVHLAIIGIGNNAIPFVLISWGETHIESSVASILQSTASLFTLVIAHFFFDDERMTPQRIGGMLAGFIGVVILFGVNFDNGEILLKGLLGQLAIVGASLFYASFITYSRVMLNNRHVRPMVVAAITMTSATIVMGILTFTAPLWGGPAPVSLTDVSRGAAQATITLGFFNTLFAYMIFYYIVSQLGAARGAMVTYIVPVVGLILGIIFLGEPLGWNLVVGAAFIMGGIGIVNLPQRKPTPTVEPA